MLQISKAPQVYPNSRLWFDLFAQSIKRPADVDSLFGEVDSVPRHTKYKFGKNDVVLRLDKEPITRERTSPNDSIFNIAKDDASLRAVSQAIFGGNGATEFGSMYAVTPLSATLSIKTPDGENNATSDFFIQPNAAKMTVHVIPEDVDRDAIIGEIYRSSSEFDFYIKSESSDQDIDMLNLHFLAFIYGLHLSGKFTESISVSSDANAPVLQPRVVSESNPEDVSRTFLEQV